MIEDPRGLTQVVEQDRRPDDGEPGDPDRSGTEVAAVGVERLGAGDAQDHATEREECLEAVVDEEPCTPDRRERLEHTRMVDHLGESRSRRSR